MGFLKELFSNWDDTWVGYIGDEDKPKPEMIFEERKIKQIPTEKPKMIEADYKLLE